MVLQVRLQYHYGQETIQAACFASIITGFDLLCSPCIYALLETPTLGICLTWEKVRGMVCKNGFNTSAPML